MQRRNLININEIWPATPQISSSSTASQAKGGTEDTTLTQFKTNNDYKRQSTHLSDGMLSAVSFMFSSKTDSAQAHADVSDSLRQSLIQYRMHQNTSK